MAHPSAGTFGVEEQRSDQTSDGGGITHGLVHTEWSFTVNFSFSSGSFDPLSASPRQRYVDGMQIDLTANTPINRANALVERIGDEILVIDPTSHRFQTMNPTGALLWDALGDTTTIGDLAYLLVTTFGIDLQQGIRDTTAFVDDLHRRGYVVAASSCPS